MQFDCRIQGGGTRVGARKARREHDGHNDCKRQEANQPEDISDSLAQQNVFRYVGRHRRMETRTHFHRGIRRHYNSSPRNRKYDWEFCVRPCARPAFVNLPRRKMPRAHSPRDELQYVRKSRGCAQYARIEKRRSALC